MLFAAQEQTLRIQSIKAKIDKQPGSPKGRFFGTKEETVVYLVRKSTKEDMKMLPEQFIGDCARSMDWKTQTGGMSIHLSMSWRMMT